MEAPEAMTASDTNTPSFDDCRDIEREHGSPFYVLDPDRFVRNFRALDAAFRARYEPIQIGYSYKTNYLPYLCHLVKDLGGLAEVVSRLEYDLAVRIGHTPKTIVFNGPLKTQEDFEIALAGGALVNIDSAYELDHLRAFAERHPAGKARVGVRVNVSVTDERGTSHVQQGLQAGRFGIPPEGLREVVAEIEALGFRLSALHGHSSSSTRSTWVYQRITETLCSMAEELAPDTVEAIDVGGGFFGRMPPGFGPRDAPSFDEYADAIVATMQRSAWVRAKRPCLLLEPGVSVAADALSFVTRVVDVKKIRGQVLVLVDGSALHVKPSLHVKNQPHSVIRPEDGPRHPERRLDVVGATCMEKDRLLTAIESDLERGDYLRIDNAGAYTITMSPPFIHPAPAIVMRTSRGFAAIRKRQSFEHLFENYRFDVPDRVVESC